ncbi:MAG TPA: hypothetical protein PKC43_09205 [Phycisphaerales bacterium]|nr:hypothetical protein [Phycisphaerales bacterium]HMP37612.1 hypothetical protein [Phycisphaerales bacterium]
MIAVAAAIAAIAPAAPAAPASPGRPPHRADAAPSAEPVARDGPPMEARDACAALLDALRSIRAAVPAARRTVEVESWTIPLDDLDSDIALLMPTGRGERCTATIVGDAERCAIEIGPRVGPDGASRAAGMRIAWDGDLALVRHPGEPIAEFSRRPRLSTALPELGAADQSLRCLLSGCGVGLGEIIDRAVACAAETRADGLVEWSADVVPDESGGGLRFEFLIDPDPAGPRLIRLRKEIWSAEDRNRGRPSLVTEFDVIEWAPLGPAMAGETAPRSVPRKVQSRSIIRRSSEARGVAVLRACTIDARIEGDVDAAVGAELALGSGERATDEALGLTLTGGSRILSVHGADFLAPDPLWNHPGAGLAALLEQARRLERTASEITRPR